MFRHVLRAALLALAAFASLASSSSSTGSRPASNPSAWEPPPGSTPGIYWCHNVRSNAGSSSLCFAQFDRCERERQVAAADGLFTTYCMQASPVACFQLGGDPSPAQEMCATTLEDCELWRTIDQDKNGSTGASCGWLH